MNTKLEDIYNAFLFKINDYDILKLSDIEIEERLGFLLNDAIAMFTKCKKNLTINTVSKEFNSQLTALEIKVLISFMIVDYLKSFLYSTEVLEQSLSDKDFKIYSQANQLRELRLLHKEAVVESQRLMTMYTYTFLGDK